MLSEKVLHLWPVPGLYSRDVILIAAEMADRLTYKQYETLISQTIHTSHDSPLARQVADIAAVDHLNEKSWRLLGRIMAACLQEDLLATSDLTGDIIDDTVVSNLKEYKNDL